MLDIWPGRTGLAKDQKHFTLSLSAVIFVIFTCIYDTDSAGAHSLLQTVFVKAGALQNAKADKGKFSRDSIV